MTCCRRRVVVHGRMPLACHNATGDWQWAKMQSGLLTMLSRDGRGRHACHHSGWVLVAAVVPR